MDVYPISADDHCCEKPDTFTSRVPARFRDALGEGVVLARGLDGNVAVYPRETWKVTR